LCFASNKYRLVAENFCWCFPRNQQQAELVGTPDLAEVDYADPASPEW